MKSFDPISPGIIVVREMRVAPSNLIHVRCALAAFVVLWLAVPAHAQILLNTDFETNPIAQGWTNNGVDATWTTNEAFSGTHSIGVSNSSSWFSPLLNTTPLQWYRLSFKSLAPGVVDNPDSQVYGYWAAQFFDTNGNLLPEDQYSGVFQSGNWVTNEFRIRAKNTAGPNATLLPVRMHILFQPITSPMFIDDVLVEATTPQEVASWGDAFYDMLPAKLAYVPKADRWAHLPVTLKRLRTGQNLRIVMLGDSVEQDTANAPWDTWLERLYPGATIEMISSTKGGTGVQFYYTDVPDWVLAYEPDLLCIGGISNDDDMSEFQSLVDQVRANDAANGRTTEILILSKQWSPNTLQGSYFLSPTLTELDEVPTNNPGGVPAGYTGDLLNFCATNDIEFLDLTGVASEFIYGPAAAAGVGPPTDSNGDPYSFWMRDFVHSSDRGKTIQGRMMEAYFAPAPTLTIEQSGSSVNLAWPLAATGYYLQTATTLLGTNTMWTSNVTVFTITNGQNVVNFPMPAGTNQLFFQLRRP